MYLYLSISHQLVLHVYLHLNAPINRRGAGGMHNNRLLKHQLYNTPVSIDWPDLALLICFNNHSADSDDDIRAEQLL